MSLINGIEPDTSNAPLSESYRKWMLTLLWLLSILPLIFFFYDQSFEDISVSTQFPVKDILRRQPSQIEELPHKPQGSIMVEILTPEKADLSSGETLTLTGRFTILNDLKEARFQWIIPDKAVEAVDGELEGELGNLLSGDQQEVQMVVRPLSSEDFQIHFEVYGWVNGERRGNITQFHSSSLKSTVSPFNQKMQFQFKGKRPRIIF